jgi:argininosuccinate lyase
MSPRTPRPAKLKPEKQKDQLWGERLSEAPELRNIAYCAGRDVATRPMADAQLIPYDIWQNRAHVVMLERKRIIHSGTARQLIEALQEFAALAEDGKIQLDPKKEDVHTNIEHFVAARAGAEVSGTIHTARSRNDQSATVVRMYVREQLLTLASDVVALIGSVLSAAEKHAAVTLAGFTHYQPASITTIGHWFASYGQALNRDLERLVRCYDRLNVSPLGAAASFGTSWPIDREVTAKLLGFAAVQDNSLDCITNRWEMEADAAAAVSFVLAHLSIIAQDIVLLSMPQIAIVKLADRYVTGSSIMPQKRNPDFAEVTRAKSALVQQLTASLFGIARGLPSGYNRDTQWTKYVIMDIFAEAADAPAIFSGVFDTLQVDAVRARESAEANFVDAVDVADLIAQECDIPFRKAYDLVSRAVKESEPGGSIDMGVVKRLGAALGVDCTPLRMSSVDAIVGRKTHAGGPAPAAVKKSIYAQREAIGQWSKTLRERRTRLEVARAELAAAETRIR